MRNLTDLLGRFAKSLYKDTDTKERIVSIIFTHTRIRLSPEKVSLKNGVLEINASPIAHQEIAFKQEAILNELQGVASRILYK